jgi:hypothetical protein
MTKAPCMQVILQVEESPDRSERTPPALIFRVEANHVVGKLCMAKVADDLAALQPEPDKAPVSPLARIGSLLGKAKGQPKQAASDVSDADKDKETEKEPEKDENGLLVTQMGRPE